MHFNLNQFNMLMAWISIFIESWFLLLGKIQVSYLSVFFFCFFLLVALFSWFGTVIEEKNNISKGEIKNEGHV